MTNMTIREVKEKSLIERRHLQSWIDEIKLQISTLTSERFNLKNQINTLNIKVNKMQNILALLHGINPTEEENNI